MRAASLYRLAGRGYRVLRGFALAVACMVAAIVVAYVAMFVARVLGTIATEQPELFMVAAVCASLAVIVRWVFRREHEFN